MRERYNGVLRIAAFVTSFVIISIALIPVPLLADNGNSFNISGNVLPEHISQNAKLDSQLNQLVNANVGQNALPLAMQMQTTTSESNIRVIIESFSGQAEEISDVISTIGEVEATYGDHLQVNIPVSHLTKLSELNHVKFVRVPMELHPAGVSEGVALMNADEWQTSGYKSARAQMGH